MSALSKHRGHDIVFSNGVWLYQSDKTPVSMDKTRKCGHCGKGQTEEGYDGCIGNLPAVKNACCGHGVEAEAYVQFLDGSCLQGKSALWYMGKAE